MISIWMGEVSRWYNTGSVRNGSAARWKSRSALRTKISYEWIRGRALRRPAVTARRVGVAARVVMAGLRARAPKGPAGMEGRRER